MVVFVYVMTLFNLIVITCNIVIYTNILILK